MQIEDITNTLNKYLEDKKNQILNDKIEKEYGCKCELETMKA